MLAQLTASLRWTPAALDHPGLAGGQPDDRPPRPAAGLALGAGVPARPPRHSRLLAAGGFFLLMLRFTAPAFDRYFTWAALALAHGMAALAFWRAGLLTQSPGARFLQP